LAREMMLGRLARTVVIATASIVAVLALAQPAGAVLSGFNGRIVFASGRGAADGDDSQAKLYLRTIDSSVGGGSTGLTITPTPGIQHRHPTWAPDRTKIAYAAGAAGNFDIFVLDLTVPGAVPENITKSNNITEDRPAWSPDGEHIAYESEVSDGSGQTDVLVQEYPVSGVSPLHLTSTSGVGAFEGKPAWSPDSTKIYYVTGNLNAANAANIVRKNSNGGGAEEDVLVDGTISEFQPSLSPDGTKLCYTRGHMVDGSADIYVTTLGNPTGPGFDLSDNVGSAAENGDFNCTWSPDGKLVAYVMGTFTKGDLVMELADDSAGPLPLESDANNFDGNPDWAPDGTPECESQTVGTKPGKPVQIALPCSDTGPAYERTEVTENISDQPDHGTLDTIDQGDPSSVVYTPNPGFSGTDKFRFNGIDARQFGTGGTVTIHVDDKRPNLKDLKIKPSVFVRGTTAKITFKLSEKARVRFKFQRPNNSFAGNFSFNAVKGKNTRKFKGKLPGGKKLAFGRYRLRARAKDAAGNVSKTKTKKFRLIKPPAAR
jgi:Bacterial Ig domain/WD40-like Beta Propeller Repeat